MQPEPDETAARAKADALLARLEALAGAPLGADAAIRDLRGLPLGRDALSARLDGLAVPPPVGRQAGGPRLAGADLTDAHWRTRISRAPTSGARA